jgi:hypothetical protein
LALGNFEGALDVKCWHGGWVENGLGSSRADCG